MLPIQIRFPGQPFHWLKLRGSSSQSFKAPDLGFLNSTRTISYTPAAYADPLRPQDGARQLKIITGGNPALQPEKGKVWYGGAVFDLAKITRGLSFSADWFNFKLTGRSWTYNTPAYLFAYFPTGSSRQFARRARPISYLEATPNNVAAYITGASISSWIYRLHQTRWGDFTFGVQTTRIDYYGFDAGVGAGPVNNADAGTSRGGRQCAGRLEKPEIWSGRLGGLQGSLF